MKIYEVYRKPGVDMSSIERFCADAQIVLEKLEEAQESGVSLAEDYAILALVSVKDRGFPLVLNFPIGAESFTGFRLMEKMSRKDTDVVYEALFLPRANCAVMPHLAKKFLDNTDKLRLLRCCNVVDTEFWQDVMWEINETVTWLGGSFSTIDTDGSCSINVKLSSWERVREYDQNQISLLCFGIERHIDETKVALNDNSERADLWKRYLSLKRCFETNTFLKEKCHDNYDLHYYGTFVTVEQANSVPTQYLGCVSFSEEGMDRLSQLIGELETISD